MHFVLAGRPTKWFLVLCSFFKLKSVELFGFGKEVRKAQVKDAETLHPQLVPWSEKTPVHSNIKGGAGEGEKLISLSPLHHLRDAFQCNG